MKTSDKHITFATAVRETPPLKLCLGLQALKGTSRRHIKVADTSSIGGSVHLDEAYRASQPNAPRWDYGIAYRQDRETIYWVEIHPADNSHVDRIIKKAEWLGKWLQSDGHRFHSFPNCRIWVATGGRMLTAKDRKSKKLAESGVTCVGNVLRIPQKIGERQPLCTPTINV